jgi:DNA-binding transcriptional LysR family regulator
MTDLNSLMIFAKVVEAKSFSEAARHLKMPTSTVSRRVADLEDQLGVRLLERSTRNLRLTDVGSEVFEHAQHSAELSEAIDNIASNHLSNVSGELRLSAPPSISDSLLAPMIGAFQASYPNVRVQVFITDRIVDQIAEGVDLVFKVGEQLKDSSLVARRILTYRHQLVASPVYLAKYKPPQNAAGPARPSATRVFVLDAREYLELHSFERKEKGDADVPAFPFDERLRWPCERAVGGHRHWRPSAVGAT